MYDRPKFDKKRFRVKHCPCGRCNRDGKFVPFEGCEDKGFCHSCGKTFTAASEKTDFCRLDEPSLQAPPVCFIPASIAERSCAHFDKNHFFIFLRNLIGYEDASKLLKYYHVGSSRHWPNATVFWQVDQAGNYRTGKIMRYEPQTGKRIKSPGNDFNFVHKVLNIANFELRQCLFGEHLLRQNDLPVALVESEKTAILARYFFPDHVWLATGGKDSLRADRLTVLHGKVVKLYPDLKEYEYWCRLAEKIERQVPGLTFKVSKLLEDKAVDHDKAQGLDIADFLIHEALNKVPVGRQMDVLRNEYPLLGTMIDKFDLSVAAIEKSECFDPCVTS